MGRTGCGENWVLLWWAVMLFKSVIQLSADRWGYAASLLIDLRRLNPEICRLYSRATCDLQNILMPGRAFQDCCCQAPCPHSRPLLIQASTEDPQTLTGKSDSDFLQGPCSFALGPFAHKILFVPTKSLSFPQSCGSSVIKSH